MGRTGRRDRAAGGVSRIVYLYDFHVHSAPRSPCAHSTAEALCRAALDRGLAGLALAEHNVWWPARDLDRLRQRFPGLAVLGGIEVSCQGDHFLVFVPEGRAFETAAHGTVAALARAVHERGGTLVWAHPFRFDARIPPWFPGAWIDGLEVASSNMDGAASERALRCAADRRLCAFRNSDAHHVSMVGRFANRLPVECRRWCAERFLAGWRWGPEKDREHRVSPDLVPWEDLPETVREYDREQVRGIPALVKVWRQARP